MQKGGEKMYRPTASCGGNESTGVDEWEERSPAEGARSAGGSPGPSVGRLPQWENMTIEELKWRSRGRGRVAWTDPVYPLPGCGPQPEAFSAAQPQHIESVLLRSVHPSIPAVTTTTHTWVFELSSKARAWEGCSDTAVAMTVSSVSKTGMFRDLAQPPVFPAYPP